MIFSEYPQKVGVDLDDVFLVNGKEGTKIINSEKLIEGICAFSPGLKKSFFRGKNLGSYVTDKQSAEIQNGRFNDLCLGDYWLINNVTWRIVDFDYWIGTGDQNCTTHHLVIMPDLPLYFKKMNETNTTVGGYVGSEMYKSGLNNAKYLIETVFGADNILNHREYLVNEVTNGYSSGGLWLDSKIELANEIMMYGSYLHSSAGDGSIAPKRYTIDKTQLSLMQIYSKFINPKRESQWLRDVVNTNIFSLVGANGITNSAYSNLDNGVRPVFGITG